MEPTPKLPWATCVAWGTTVGVGALLYLALASSVFLPRTWLGAGIALVGIGGPLVAWRRIKFSTAESLGTSLCWGLDVPVVAFLLVHAAIVPHPVSNCLGVLSFLTAISVPMILWIRSSSPGFTPWARCIHFGLGYFAILTVALGLMDRSASLVQWSQDARMALPGVIMLTLFRRMMPMKTRLGIRDSIKVAFSTWPRRSRKASAQKVDPS